MKTERKKLGSIAEIYNGNSINTDYKKKHFCGLTDGYPFIATKDVSPDGLVDYENGVKIPYDEGLKVAPANSVFVCAEGGSAGKKIAYIFKDVCFGNKLFCIKPRDINLYSAKYLYYFCRSELFREQFFGELTGVIGGVSTSKFKNIECPFPTLPEQERIVAYLDEQFARIDALKANAENQLQAAKDLFQTALKELLTPKEGWEKKSFMELCDSISAGGDAPKGRVSEERTEKFCYPIYSNGVEEEGLYGYTDDYKINKPAITIAARGTIGATFIRNKPFTPIVRLITLIPNINIIDIHYLYYAVKALNIGHTGSSIPQLTVPMLRDFNVSFPVLSEQQQIAAQLDAISERMQQLQSNYNETITLCNDLKQALLKSIFE